ncbi:uncharacterized protein B0T15DRAFT_164194 [Chaetomium strumarium]|uniref:G-patch domain-containing protein n=1 Tax=Chaetomium strumarium TaxID=1170767 RepID=A0AAJ0GVY7_9PEZI|nr:hypothetical protein B0T15DRAFT_164194 [Chaetomium strumarium]
MSLQKDKDIEDDDYDDIPLQHKRPFGAGLHRKPIAFVSASDGDGHLKSVDDAAVDKGKTDVADLYLSMVLPDDATRSKSAPPSSGSARDNERPESELCAVCRLPLGTDKETHEQSFAHQVCLPYSQPPSALDRSRKGLAYLSAYGWDPDARRGLGAEQQGIQYPIKPKVKDDNLGIGMEVPKGLPPPKKKEQLLDAKKVRKMALDEKKKAARIHQELFGDSKLEKYLGKRGTR